MKAQPPNVKPLAVAVWDALGGRSRVVLHAPRGVMVGYYAAIINAGEVLWPAKVIWV